MQLSVQETKLAELEAAKEQLDKLLQDTKSDNASLQANLLSGMPSSHCGSINGKYAVQSLKLIRFTPCHLGCWDFFPTSCYDVHPLACALWVVIIALPCHEPMCPLDIAEIQKREQVQERMSLTQKHHETLLDDISLLKKQLLQGALWG